jgi:hypothetical protein
VGFWKKVTVVAAIANLFEDAFFFLLKIWYPEPQQTHPDTSNNCLQVL